MINSLIVNEAFDALIMITLLFTLFAIVTGAYYAYLKYIVGEDMRDF